jgi:hypothetical protein
MKTILICCLSMLLLPTIAARAQGIVPKIETKLGHELTPDQRRQIQEAAQKELRAMKAEQEKFVVAVAGIFQLPQEEIWTYMPKLGGGNAGFDKNMVPKLEKSLNRPLRQDELTKLREADAAKKKAMHPIQDEFAGAVARVTGLKLEDVQALLPKIGQ